MAPNGVTGLPGNWSLIGELILNVGLRTQHRRFVRGRSGVLPGRQSDDQVSFIYERDLGKII